ncbi:MAG: hypothetical protein IKI01_09585 [Lachnospiraceae bacterium]|nr:hypothetical protein [Lachnospiraceae bacterium]
MKRVLYVDFENVSSAGLNGVLKLTKNDEVKIFLGPKCSKMSLIEAESILHCDATVELIKNDQIGKNALDFIIMVHLGYDIAKREGDAFFIISNDKGYEPAIHEMQSKTGETIERYPDIEHVIARKDEAPGLFARLFGKKKPVVENTTEHEVLRKGGRTTGSRTTSGRSGNGSGRNTNGAGRSGNGAGSGSGRNTSARNSGNRNANTRGTDGRNTGGRNAGGRNSSNGNGNRQGNGAGKNVTVNRQNGEPNNVKVTPAEKQQATVEVKTAPQVAAQVNNSPAPAAKPVEQAKKPTAVAGAKPKAIVKASTKPGSPITITTQDDSYLDNLSIADLRAQLNVASAEPAQPKQPKRPVPARTELTESERALVERALAETDNLGDFHNYILKELHDNDRATEIYKSEKHKVGKK